MDVLIAGGGIAGLTMALTCRQIGVKARLYEPVETLRPLGLGINLQPRAVRELHELGLEEELAEIAVPTRELVFVAPDGRDIWVEPRGREAGYLWPQYSVHRGELQMMLYRAVVDRLGPDAVVTGHRVVRYAHDVHSVLADVEGADGSFERVEGEVLLGCDGLHSSVRSQMFPGEGGPRWGGTVLWRGATRGPQLRGGGSFIVVGNAEQRFVTFPLTAPDDDGMQVHNWIAEQKFDPLLGWRRGDWNTLVETTEFIDGFADWRFDWLDVPALIRRCDQIFEYPMVDRDPVDHWVHGSVALLGDAAHAMYPVGSNGASQAIVDARVLGAAFVAHGVGRSALQAYEAALVNNVSRLVLRNRQAGPASILDAVVALPTDIFEHIDSIAPDDLERFVASYRTTTAASIADFNDAPSAIGS